MKPTTLSAIQTITRTVCEIRKVGVPKKRAKPSARTPNQSSPNAEERCAWGSRNRKWWPGAARDSLAMDVRMSRPPRGEFPGPGLVLAALASLRGRERTAQYLLGFLDDRLEMRLV